MSTAQTWFSPGGQHESSLAFAAKINSCCRWGHLTLSQAYEAAAAAAVLEGNLSSSIPFHLANVSLLSSINFEVSAANCCFFGSYRP